MSKRLQALILVMGVAALVSACSDSTDSQSPGSVVDPAGPTVVSTSPADASVSGAEEVSWSSPVVVVFSEPVDPSTVTAETFQVGPGSEGTISVDGATVTWTGKYAFDPAILVQVRLGGDISDRNGNRMGEDYTFIFYTQVDPG